jgi:ABC-type bacteriocin/lantibiotic exporters, contain an N-terminal double-glycine peptidase domain
MPDLEVINLCFQDRGPYSFRIDGGECVGLQGASGAGKSLLLRAIVDLDPRTGKLRLGGIDADRVPAPQWRRLVGLLPAESGWWLDRVGEHFADFRSVDDAILAAVGFDRSVGNWQVSRLSTGERQRLAIVRLLANSPQCLLLDEPDRQSRPRIGGQCRGLAVELLRGASGVVAVGQSRSGPAGTGQPTASDHGTRRSSC